MTNKQFAESLLVFAWVLSVGILSLSTLSMSSDAMAANPNALLGLMVLVFINIGCSVRWLLSHLKLQDKE